MGAGRTDGRTCLAYKAAMKTYAKKKLGNVIEGCNWLNSRPFPGQWRKTFFLLSRSLPRNYISPLSRLAEKGKYIFS